jgi:hypothetical protein
MLEPEETGISSNLPKLEGKVAKVLLLDNHVHTSRFHPHRSLKSSRQCPNCKNCKDYHFCMDSLSMRKNIEYESFSANCDLTKKGASRSTFTHSTHTKGTDNSPK